MYGGWVAASEVAVQLTCTGLPRRITENSGSTLTLSAPSSSASSSSCCCCWWWWRVTESPGGGGGRDAVDVDVDARCVQVERWHDVSRTVTSVTVRTLQQLLLQAISSTPIIHSLTLTHTHTHTRLHASAEMHHANRAANNAGQPPTAYSLQ